MEEVAGGGGRSSPIRPPRRPVGVVSHGGLVLAIVIVVATFVAIVVVAAVILRFLLPLAFDALVGHVQHVPANVAPHPNMTVLLENLIFISFAHFGFGGKECANIERSSSVSIDL
jgi:hypothetical protein